MGTTKYLLLKYNKTFEVFYEEGTYKGKQVKRDV